MTKDETLKLALEALEGIRRYGLDTLSGRIDGPDDREWQRAGVNEMTKQARLAITAIKEHKEALAQPEQEPVAWEQFYPDIGKPQIAFNAEVIGYVAPQPKQEPLAWISTGTARMIHWTSDKPAYGDDWVPLYTTPPQRKPMMDEDVERIVREALVGEHGIGYTIARAIEAAHGIKE